MNPAYSSEKAARAWIAQVRWPDGVPICPRCGGKGRRATGKVTNQQISKSFRCRNCKNNMYFNEFTFFGPFRNTGVSARKWVEAIHSVASGEKPSPNRLSARLGMAYTTAARMCKVLQGGSPEVKKLIRAARNSRNSRKTYNPANEVPKDRREALDAFMPPPRAWAFKNELPIWRTPR